jgi:hypothetical protein
VKELDDTANRLMQTQAQSIYEHQKEINDRWSDLMQKVNREIARVGFMIDGVRKKTNV